MKDTSITGNIIEACTRVFGAKMKTTFVVSYQQRFIGADGQPLIMTYYTNCLSWNVVGERIPKRGDTITLRGRLCLDEQNRSHIQVKAYTIA